MRIIPVILTGLLLVGGSITAAAPDAGGDWPQWRGPQRNGAAGGGPALAATWPADGPPLLWKSEGIPSMGDGGYGSPVIARGRVYQFVAWGYRTPLPNRVLSAANADKFGLYAADLPEALRDRIEAARTSADRAGLKDDALKEWVQKWLAGNLDAEQQKKFARYAQERLTRGAAATSLDVLAKVHGIKKKTFEPKDFDAWVAGAGLADKEKEALLKLVPVESKHANDVLLCLDLADGKTLWKKTFPGAVQGHGSSSTPCVVDGRLLVAGSGGTAYCLDAGTGDEIWKADLGKGAVNSSFAVAEGLALIQAGPLLALDLATGKLRWKADKVKGSDTSPVVWSSGGKTYVLSNTDKLYCVELATGQVAWEAPGGGRATPVVGGDVVAVLTEKKEGDGLLLYRLSAAKAEPLATAAASSRGSTPVLAGDLVLAAANDKAVCVSLKSGQIAWQGKAPKDGFSSPILADGKLLVIGGGTMSLLDASAGAYKNLAQTKAPVLTCTSPALAEGRLVLRGKEGLYCYDLRAAER